MATSTQQIHRRKSSKDENEISLSITSPTVEVAVPEAHELPSVMISAPPVRTRTQSTPHVMHSRSSSTTSLNLPSTSPFRSNLSPRPLNGHSMASPFRSTFSAPMMPPHMNGHSRTRSISTPFSPVSPSPLSSSFPISPPPSVPSAMSTSQSAPEASQQNFDGQQSQPLPKPNRRHGRIHSRNLSVFFPRPGSLPTSTISEDGTQELQVTVDEEAPLVPSASPSVSMPGARQPITPLGQGFTFGGRPPSSLPTPELMTGPRSSSTSKKRGHHHKHSLSHNFFSFLEPGNSGPVSRDEDLHTQPTPIPLSPWGPMSAFPDSAASSKTNFAFPAKNGHAERSHPPHKPERISSAALAVSIGQFVLGAWFWVTGQQVGSLSCTGLGYWVVFDSFGVAVRGVIPGWLATRKSQGSAAKEKEKIRRPYGNGRVETVLIFAQAVYLMFSSVYVCKETVEHLLLSVGGEGHHHHHGDEEVGLGIDFPIFMTFVTFFSIIGTANLFENHIQLVNITGNRIPSIRSLIRSIWTPTRRANDAPPTSSIGLIFSNPFVSSPLFFCLSILFVATFLPIEQHRLGDLVLAFIIAALTFKVAYRACVVLGTVLLQTSPPRGLPSGKMEAFLRAMREVERHPQVLHLPAPHIWQLTPSYVSSTLSTTTSQKSSVPSESLVVTLEIHVKEDLGDDDVLKLTKWAWERCVSALYSLRDFREMGEEGAPEVTIGVVRG